MEYMSLLVKACGYYKGGELNSDSACQMNIQATWCISVRDCTTELDKIQCPLKHLKTILAFDYSVFTLRF